MPRGFWIGPGSSRNSRMPEVASALGPGPTMAPETAPIIGRRHHAALRRRHRAVGRFVRGRSERDPRDHRAQRRRQELHAQLPERLQRAAAGQVLLSGPGDHRAAAAPDRATRCRAHLPGPSALPGPDRHRQPAHRPAHAHEDQSPSGFLLSRPTHGEEMRERRRVEEIIDFLEIKHIRHMLVGSLELWPAQANRPGAGAGHGARRCCSWTSPWRA